MSDLKNLPRVLPEISKNQCHKSLKSMKTLREFNIITTKKGTKMIQQGWVLAHKRLPKRWERVAVIEMDEIEPKISFIENLNFFTAQGKTFTQTVWVGIKKQVIWWTPLPPLPKKPKKKSKN